MINKGRKFFTVVLVVIIVVAVGLLGFLGYKYISAYFIDKEAEQVVNEFENEFSSIITVAIDDENTQVNEEQPTTGNTVTTTKNVKHKGYDVIGTIKIPKTRISYPIVDDTSPRAMEVAIVMLYGPGLNQVGNTVIVGHNYRQGGFFGNNKKLENGDKIYITDATGVKREYVVYNKYITTDSDFSYATRNTEGRREISLSTCTSDASKRLVIWAKEN